MKARIALISGAAAACMALSGCGGGGNMASNPVAPPPPTATMLDTTQVLDIVRTRTSETTLPFAVNGGVVVFTDVDDSIQATVVDGT